jgi:hypothetical protein
MIALDRPELVLQAQLASAASTEPVASVVARTIAQATKASFEDYQSRLTRSVLAGASPVTICDAPAQNAFKAVEYIGITNRSTATEILTVSTYDGVNRYPLIVRALTANQSLYYRKRRGWYLGGAASQASGASSGVIGVGVIGIMIIGQPMFP